MWILQQLKSRLYPFLHTLSEYSRLTNLVYLLQLKLEYSTFYAPIEGSQMHEKHRYLILELSWFLSCQ